jgi:hypothetical protein
MIKLPTPEPSGKTGELHMGVSPLTQAGGAARHLSLWERESSS